jgi:inosine-uridine nucleoside N-ribohydrolase
MGFDDWGAFAVLQAAGCMPKKALTTKGMMLTKNFSLSFANLLKSWNFSTDVHEGSEECYQPPCRDMSFIQDTWEYRTNVWKKYDGFLGPGSAAGTLLQAADFWKCGSKKFTLLVLAPMSDVATKLMQDKAARNCVDRIIVSGGYFANDTVLKEKDPSTYLFGVIDASDPPGDPTIRTRAGELNIVSDPLAAQAVFALDIPITIVPLEVESIDRIGKQMLKVVQNQTAQTNVTDAQTWALCSVGNYSGTPNFLGRLACKHSGGGDVATLDMDAIVATSLWGPTKFTFDKDAWVVVQDDGLTKTCALPEKGCRRVTLATDFNAIAWYQGLSLHMGMSQKLQ